MASAPWDLVICVAIVFCVPHSRTFHQVFEIIEESAAWIVFWNMVFFELSLYAVLVSPSAWAWILLGCAICLIVLPLSIYVMHVAFSNTPSVTLIGTSALIGFASLCLAMYLSICIAHMSKEFGSTTTSRLLDAIHFVFLAGLIWSWNRVIMPRMLHWRVAEYAPEDLQLMDLSDVFEGDADKSDTESLDEDHAAASGHRPPAVMAHWPGAPKGAAPALGHGAAGVFDAGGRWRPPPAGRDGRVLDAEAVVKRASSGQLFEGVAVLDALVLQGAVYMVLLGVAYAVVICPSSGCGGDLSKTLVEAGFWLVAGVVVVVAAVDLVVTARAKRSRILFINAPLALLCPRTFSFAFLGFCMKMASQAYLVCSKEVPRLRHWAARSGLEILEIIQDHKTSTEGFVAAYHLANRQHAPAAHHRLPGGAAGPGPACVLFVAFAGTQDKTDTCMDLKMWRQPWAAGPAPWTAHLPTPDPRGQHPKVHAGFQTSWLAVRDAVWQAVHRALAQGRVDQVYVVGHSLGGALATLCATDLRQSGCVPAAVPLCVVTIGSPKVGNQAFHLLHDRLVPWSFHVENLGDPIPKGPPILYWPQGHHILLPNDRILTSTQRLVTTLVAAIVGARPDHHFAREYQRRLRLVAPLSNLPQWAYFHETLREMSLHRLWHGVR